MKLIPFEDALNIMLSISDTSESLDKIHELSNIQTIDPIATIDEMIEKKNKELSNSPELFGTLGKTVIKSSINTLQELKSRLSLTK